MKIVGVELTESSTVISLTVTNMAAGGYFCVDPDTWVILPDGTRLKLSKAMGIPSCPDVHSFRRIGEVIAFTLHFPRLEATPEWIDLVEECTENCFSVYGITLDNDLNAQIDIAYGLAESGQPEVAGIIFREILSGLEDEKHGILGSLYSNIIIMSLREGKEGIAEEWYGKMLTSEAPNLKCYVDNLAARGIKW